MNAFSRLGLGLGLVAAGMVNAADKVPPAPILTIDGAAGKETSARRMLAPSSAEHVTVYQEEGRYGGWPANHGLWQWGDELVAGFTSTWYKRTDGHQIDRSKPSYEWQARSLDGGRTWKTESDLPFADQEKEAKPSPLTEALDFAAPDFALMFRFGSLHAGPSWFYTSLDRCKTWRGPWSFTVPGVERICTRTDLIVLGPRDCLMFGSCGKKNDGKEGRVFCARTTDGALTWKLVSLIGEETVPGGYAIMPSSLRLKDGSILTMIRRSDPKVSGFIEAWRSTDLGKTWTMTGKAVTGIGGNPPALVQLQDGRVAVTYGFRHKPSSMRACISADGGMTWGQEILLREDAIDGDIGYPRSVVRPDGKVLTVYYYSGPRHEDRTIQGTFWAPPARSSTSARETITNSIGMKLVRIEAGSFTMGQDGPAADYKMTKHPEKFDDADWDEKPAHKVVITQPFFMGATEVTVGQYRQSNPDFRKSSADDEAVSSISWEQAAAFCTWLSKKENKPYRLPTEAEWEYVCRAGTTTLFNTGDALPNGFQPWPSDPGYAERYFKGGEFPAPYGKTDKISLRVAQTPPNPWGLHDMHGNVAEWCSDWYGPYAEGEQTDPRGRSDGEFRVFRGGHHSAFARLLRSANRSAWLPGTRNNKTGFRVVQGDLPKGSLLPPAAAPLHAQNVKQGVPKIEKGPQDMPVFEGPKPFVKIPDKSFGPLFSTHNHSPGITECPNGDLLAIWYSCVDEGGSELTNVASRLRHGSKEWEQASPFWEGADVNDHGPKIWWDGKSTLYNLVRGRDENLIRTSTDNGVTWSRPILADPVGEFGNQMIRLADGTLVITNDARNSSLVFSHDGGKTWDWNDTKKQASDFRPGGKGVRYPGIHTPIVQLADGRVMAISRNDPPEDQARFGFKTPISYTSDLGKSWTYAASEFPAISSVQRAAMIRLQEGAILVCSFTDQWRDWKNRKGMTFKAADGKKFTGYGMFAALSFDEGKTWPVRRLITPGGKDRTTNGIDRVEFIMSGTMAEPCGYLSAIQSRDGSIQLITSKNHYVFNLAWLKSLPAL